MEISIIGGGITGLTTALALHKMGIQANVYEQAESLNEIGAGIWLQPNALQVLKWLGIYDDIKQEGWVLDKMEITNSNLKAIKQIDRAVVTDKFGNQTTTIHRGKLQRILYDKFKAVGNIELNMPFQHHISKDNKSELHFANKTILTDVVLGADGIKSNVRKSMGLDSIYRNSNQICYRGIAEMELPENLKYDGKEAWGHKRRFGFSQLSNNTVYFFAVLNKEIGSKTLTTESLSAFFESFHPIVSQIIQSARSMHVAELSDLKRLDTWHNSYTCLLGDAAHATTPNMGQGACQGIEDAYYFSQIFQKSGSTVQERFKIFEKMRRKKVDYVVNNSWLFGKMAHHPIGQNILKTMMKLTPERVLNNQINKLYSLDSI